MRARASGQSSYGTVLCTIVACKHLLQQSIVLEKLRVSWLYEHSTNGVRLARNAMEQDVLSLNKKLAI